MKLPSPERAVVDIRKLGEYCLNAEHPRGQHKARVFKSALGWTADQAEDVRRKLLDVVLLKMLIFSVHMTMNSDMR